MRVRWFRCKEPDPPALPQRVRSTTRPAWMTQPTCFYPRPGSVGRLTPAQQWRANGGRW